jgi:signal recognition particle GTPase
MSVLSTTTINNLGLLNADATIAPNKFLELSEKKQKNIILARVRDIMMQVTETVSDNEKAVRTIREKQKRLGMSQEVKELKRLKKEYKQSSANIKNLLQQFEGIKKITGDLGIDLAKEFKNTQQLEG